MNAPLLLSVTLAVGLWLIVTGQPIGRRRPDLGARLRRLSMEGRAEAEARARAAAGPGVLPAALVRRLDAAGSVLARALEGAGMGGDLERRLALVSPGMDAARFRGQQLAGALAAFAVFPALNVLGGGVLGPWPPWLWVAAGAAGFAAPVWRLSRRVQRRRAWVLAELPAVLDVLVIAASAGLSAEQALVEAGRRLDGVLAAGLRTVAREAGLGIAGYAAALRDLAEREGVPEVRALADAWQLSQDHGVPIGPAMLALADTVRERRRVRLLEEGRRGSVRMVLPVALFIFPVFLVVLLYPAGVELLGLAQ